MCVFHHGVIWAIVVSGSISPPIFISELCSPRHCDGLIVAMSGRVGGLVCVSQFRVAWFRLFPDLTIAQASPHPGS
jgi:hypothetical protein